MPPPPPYGQPGYAPYGQPPYGYGQDPNTVIIPGRGPVQLASAGKRILARLIDIVVLIIILAILAGIGLYSFHVSHTTTDSLGTRTTTLDGGVYARDILVQLVLYFLYDTLLIGGTGATLGMKLLGIGTVSPQGQQPTFGAAAIRALLLVVLGTILCGIGYLIIGLSFLWDGKKQRQGWHDKAASTFVISTR
jgi:uncharacterized RDD family membrane protein YckC